MKFTPFYCAVNKPNLMFRKAKVTGRTLEQMLNDKVLIPNFKGEALFGIYPVLESLEINKRTPHRLYLKSTVRDRAAEDPRIERIIQLATEKNLPTGRLTQAQFDRITNFQLHNGICLDTSPLPFSKLSNCKLSIFLDNVVDTGNIGAICRSSLFFGVQQIIFCRKKGPSSITPSMSKASCGATERIPIVCLDNKEDFFQFFSKAVFIGTSDQVSAVRYEKPILNLEDLVLPTNKDIVLVLGDEHSGISPSLISRCDVLLAVRGTSANIGHVNSLNVSVVTGIILQKLYHKLE